MSTTSIILSSLISGTIAFLVAIIITYLIEKLGGIAGGVLGGSPTTIVVTGIGIVLASENDYDVIIAMYYVPLSLLLDIVVLLCWRYLPDYLLKIKYFKTEEVIKIEDSNIELDEYVRSSTEEDDDVKEKNNNETDENEESKGPQKEENEIEEDINELHGKKKKIFVVLILIITIIFWFFSATFTYFPLSRLFQKFNINVRVLGVICMTLQIIIGFLATYNHTPNSKAKNFVNVKTYILRGIFAGGTVSVCILVSKYSEGIAGLLSVFPAILLSSLASLWISHGKKLVQSSLGPLLLGSVSLGVYGISFSEIFYFLVHKNDINLYLSIVIAVFFAYLITISLSTLPILGYLTYKQKKHEKNIDSSLEISDNKSNDDLYETEEQNDELI